MPIREHRIPRKTVCGPVLLEGVRNNGLPATRGLAPEGEEPKCQI